MEQKPDLKNFEIISTLFALAFCTAMFFKFMFF